MKININTTARVKLTALGSARYYEITGVSGAVSLELMLWELMQFFGPGLHMGMNSMYFEHNEIELCVKT